MRHLRWLLLFVAPSCASLAEPAAPLPPPPTNEASVKPGANENFLSAELDVDEYVGRFEGESREIAVCRDALLEVLALQPGERVADVGAGTGLFLRPMADAVGPTGKLFAVDISPGFVEHLEERALAEGLWQVEVVQCSERSVDLPERSVDVVFVCDTYHHFEYPQSTLFSIGRALRPGGRLIVVDFERIPGVTREWLLDHVRAGKDVFRAEIERAGFRFVREVEVEGLEENYVLEFVR